MRRTELRELVDAVVEMRAAQRLELDALPANLRIWKSARQKRAVARLEERVDALAEALRRTWSAGGSGDPGA